MRCPGGGIGRHTRFRGERQKHAGSSPVLGTIYDELTGDFLMLNKKWMTLFLSVEAVVAGSLCLVWTMNACYSSQTVNLPSDSPAAISMSAVSPPASRPPATDYKVVGKFRDTFYYVVLESDYPSRVKDTPVRDMNDQVLAMVPKAFKTQMDIEGTGKLADGRVINFAGRKERETRYQFTVHRYGRGVGNCELVPFYSVAMDKNQIALGSIIFIDETLGVKLPDGSYHDGYWRVDDVGGAIKKDRIDLFVGTPHWGHYLSNSNIDHLQPLTVRLVSGPVANTCVNDTPR